MSKTYHGYILHSQENNGQAIVGLQLEHVTGSIPTGVQCEVVVRPVSPRAEAGQADDGDGITVEEAQGLFPDVPLGRDGLNTDNAPTE